MILDVFKPGIVRRFVEELLDVMFRRAPVSGSEKDGEVGARRVCSRGPGETN